ncbi:MAG: DUF2304 domain-containing protein [Lachnospiraceae bacterium]
MTMMLRIVLIAASVLTTVVMTHKIRRSKMRIEDSLFWVLCSLLLLLFSLFPSVADLLSDLVGTYSTSNFIFLFMIFLLLVKVFSLTIRISQLENKIKELVQKMALESLEASEKETVQKPGKEAGGE